MATENTELEGFICPICYNDLGSMYHLLGHFETDHPDEDTAIVDQIKGLFGKAKKFLTKEEQVQNTFQPNTSSLSPPSSKLAKETTYCEPQDIGPGRSHTDYFKSFREQRIDRFMRETNNILNRLDKLIKIDPGVDDKKRKDIEKSLVTWASDKQTKICMMCGGSFGLRRRRHHCRLCGCVMCHNCSQFLSHDYARKLTNPSFQFEGMSFRSSGSQSSLNSFADAEGSLHLRICSECRFLLERREEQMESRHLKPPLVHLYESIKEYMDEADHLVPLYTKMADSLSEGESTYDLQEAQEMRSQLMKLCQCIAAYVKTLAQDSSESDMKLRQMVGQQVGWYVQERLVGLQKLPSEGEIVGVRERRRRDAEKRIAEERRVEEMWRDRYEERVKNGVGLVGAGSSGAAGASGASGGSRDKLVSGLRRNGDSQDKLSQSNSRPTITPGWIPEKSSINTNPFFEGALDDDPLLQQINNIERYIMQARKDERWDELKMLNENLKQLKIEYRNQS